MKLLVTGSSGFIGFHLSKKLLSQSHQVLGIDNHNDYYDVNLKLDRKKELIKYKNFNFKKCDLINKIDLENSFNEFEPEIVINLAAQAGVRNSSLITNNYLDSNIIGFLNLIELSKKNNIKKFIYASSSSVYASSKLIPFSEQEENLEPISLYGKTKLANERIVELMSKTEEIQFIGLRFFTVYGSYGRPDMAYYKFAEKIKKNEPITIFNSGNMKRDMTHIDDIIEGILACIHISNFSSKHEIFNLGNSNPVGTMELLELIELHYGKKAHITFENSSNEVKITFADISKSYDVLNFKPKIKIHQGMREFLKWYDEIL
jgi:UDP-glucuronate 4-epimerase